MGHVISIDVCAKFLRFSEVGRVNVCLSMEEKLAKQDVESSEKFRLSRKTITRGKPSGS